MINMVSKFIRFCHISWGKRLFILRILILYTQVSIIVDFFPVKKYFSSYFLNSHTLDEDVDLQPLRKEIGSIKRILRNCPFNISCLKESMVIQKYFRKQRILIPIYLGINKEMQMKAHAWVLNETSIGYTTLKELK